MADRLAQLDRARAASGQFFTRSKAMEDIADRLAQLDKTRIASEQLFTRSKAMEDMADRLAQLDKTRIASEQLFTRSKAMEDMADRLAQLERDNPLAKQLLSQPGYLAAKVSGIAEKAFIGLNLQDAASGLDEATFQSSMAIESNRITSEVVDAAKGSDVAVLLGRLDDIVVRLNRIENPGLRTFLLNHFWSLVGNLIAGIIGFYIALCLPVPTKQAPVPSTPAPVSIQHVRKNLAHEMQFVPELKEYRIVSRKELIVRNGRSSAARRVASLHLGDLVHVIEKRSEWIHIEWREENGDYGAGWVKSKYLISIGNTPRTER